MNDGAEPVAVGSRMATSLPLDRKANRVGCQWTERHVSPVRKDSDYNMLARCERLEQELSLASPQMIPDTPEGIVSPRGVRSRSTKRW